MEPRDGGPDRSVSEPLHARAHGRCGRGFDRANPGSELFRHLPGPAADLRPDRGDRSPRVQPTARLHWPVVVRPFRLFRRRRLYRGLRSRASRPAFDGILSAGRDSRRRGHVGAVRLYLRSPYADLFRHPDLGDFAGDLQPGDEALLGHRRQRWDAGAAPSPVVRGAQLLGPLGFSAVHQFVLLLCAGDIRRLCPLDVGDRAFAVWHGAAGHSRQRGAGAFSRSEDPPVPLDRLSRVGHLHRGRGHPLGAAQRFDDPGRAVLDILGRDRVHRAARRVSQLHRAARRRHRLHLSEDLRGGDDLVLAAVARGGAGHPGAGIADRHRRRDIASRTATAPAESLDVILLKTVDLRKQFGETRACDGLNFVVNKGEFLSLVGSNGAGKTTLVNLISAHLQPDSGQILLEDRDITFTTVTERIKAGILAQGERKLLDVAVAYAPRPRLLFLDEPTSGVSTHEKAQIMDTVSSVVRGGQVTAVVIEHDMDVVFRYSDRIVMMHEGAFLADGTPDEIRANPDVASILLGAPLTA